MKNLFLSAIICLSILTYSLAFCISCNSPKPVKVANVPKGLYQLLINQAQIPPVSDITSPYEAKPFRGVIVPLALFNNSSDTLKYVNMSCSSEDIFSTNINQVVLFSHICEKNVPEIHIVPPGQSENIGLDLVVSAKKSSKTKFKVAMKLVIVDSMLHLDDYISNHKGKTIWSNEVHLQ